MQKNKAKLLNTRTMLVLAMVTSIAFLLAATLRFPVVPAVSFLRYDPKDIVIVMAGFLFGPVSALLVTVAVSLIQMFTTSATGVIGFAMNVISGTAFACTAAFIYRLRRSLSGAVIGLTAGTIAMTGVMMLWNYIVTPGFLGIPREAVVAILIPGILPFNLFNGIVNSALVLLLYKPVSVGLQKAGVMPPPPTQTEKKRLLNPALVAISLFVIISSVLWYLSMQGFF